MFCVQRSLSRRFPSEFIIAGTGRRPSGDKSHESGVIRQIDARDPSPAARTSRKRDNVCAVQVDRCTNGFIGIFLNVETFDPK